MEQCVQKDFSHVRGVSDRVHWAVFVSRTRDTGGVQGRGRGRGGEERRGEILDMVFVN